MIRVFNAVANDVRKLIVLLVILAVPFAALGVGLTATSVIAGHDDPNELHACYAPWGKIMRYTDDPASCAGYESVVSWSQQGVQGEQGEQGIQGDQGDPGISGWERVSEIHPVASSGLSGAAVNCPAGKKVFGGGVDSALTFSSGRPVMMESYPSSDTAWSVLMHNGSGVAFNMTLWAICANVSP